MSKIMVLEDDYEILTGIKELLEMKHYEVITARSVAEFKKKEAANLYLLDITLPDGDGFEVCRQIRQISDVPVLFITSCDDQDSIVKGLDIGGDDYITKPFYTGELLSRIQANLRRSARATKTGEIEDETQKVECASQHIYQKEELLIYLDEYKVFRNHTEINLTSTEFQLLNIFVTNKGILLKREVLLDKIWDNSGNYVENNTLTVAMSRLKSKLGTYGTGHESYIETIRNVGYRWRE